MKRSTLPTNGLCLLVAVIYFVGAELGLSLASLHENVTPVWPPTGIAIASVLIFGPRVLPGVFVGALAANLPTSLPIPFAFGIAVGNATLTSSIGSVTAQLPIRVDAKPPGRP